MDGIPDEEHAGKEAFRICGDGETCQDALIPNGPRSIISAAASDSTCDIPSVILVDDNDDQAVPTECNMIILGG
jgi:hypothetical protein